MTAEKRARGLSPLLTILRFLLPYKARLWAAGCALAFTAGATLFLGRGIQVLIDEGFSGGTSADLSGAISVIMVIAAAMAVG
ncbi:MAG: ABC transporter ATP-binding protein, partial [Haliea sp.]|nr:ABC transporter ATP-binding protein [Haliea sp.]